jgi:release factor glutamine methyltransferase
MESRGSLVAEAAVVLSQARIQEPRRLARRLVASALAISRAELFAHPDLIVAEPQVKRLRCMLSRLAGHEPLSRILGKREFWGLELSLTPDTLDPRPETETVVEAVLRWVPDRDAPLRLLDLGTGTGCLLLALLTEFPRASGVGIEIAEAAARTASRNAAAVGFADRARFVIGEWASAVSGRFDVIVANPPYIASKDFPLLPPEVARHDPRRALDGGEHGLDAYRPIAADLPRLLAPGGIFVAEVGFGQAPDVAEIIAAEGLTIEEIRCDLAGVLRCVVASSLQNGHRKPKKGWNTPQSRLG